MSCRRSVVAAILALLLAAPSSAQLPGVSAAASSVAAPAQTSAVAPTTVASFAVPSPTSVVVVSTSSALITSAATTTATSVILATPSPTPLTTFSNFPCDKNAGKCSPPGVSDQCIALNITGICSAFKDLYAPLDLNDYLRTRFPSMRSKINVPSFDNAAAFDSLFGNGDNAFMGKYVREFTSFQAGCEARSQMWFPSWFCMDMLQYYRDKKNPCASYGSQPRVCSSLLRDRAYAIETDLNNSTTCPISSEAKERGNTHVQSLLSHPWLVSDSDSSCISGQRNENYTYNAKCGYYYESTVCLLSNCTKTLFTESILPHCDSYIREIPSISSDITEEQKPSFPVLAVTLGSLAAVGLAVFIYSFYNIRSKSHPKPTEDPKVASASDTTLAALDTNNGYDDDGGKWKGGDEQDNVEQFSPILGRQSSSTTLQMQSAYAASGTSSRPQSMMDAMSGSGMVPPFAQSRSSASFSSPHGYRNSMYGSNTSLQSMGAAMQQEQQAPTSPSVLMSMSGNLLVGTTHPFVLQTVSKFDPRLSMTGEQVASLEATSSNNSPLASPAIAGAGSSSSAVTSAQNESNPPTTAFANAVAANKTQTKLSLVASGIASSSKSSANSQTADDATISPATSQKPSKIRKRSPSRNRNSTSEDDTTRNRSNSNNSKREVNSSVDRPASIVMAHRPQSVTPITPIDSSLLAQPFFSPLGRPSPLSAVLPISARVSNNNNIISDQPQQTTVNEERVIDIGFTAAEWDEVTMNAGDIAFIEVNFSDGWACGCNKTTNAQGFFPMTCFTGSSQSTTTFPTTATTATTIHQSNLSTNQSSLAIPTLVPAPARATLNETVSSPTKESENQPSQNKSKERLFARTTSVNKGDQFGIRRNPQRPEFTLGDMDEEQ